MEPKENRPSRFETVCRYKDSNPSNLNKLFSSYGCNTLEAKVPVVPQGTVDNLLGWNSEERALGALALKSQSAARGLEGKGPQTANKSVKMVEVDGQMVIATGQTRDRSPVDRNQLDKDLEEYTRQRDKKKASRGLITEQTNRLAAVSLDADDMEADLDAYMKEAARLKAQKKLLIENSERLSRMEAMEDMEDWEEPSSRLKIEKHEF